MPTRRPAVLPALLLLVSTGAAAAQERPGPVALPGETKQFVSRLKFADDLAARRKWAEAVDEYQRLLHEAGDALVPAEADRDGLGSPPRSVQLRRLCQVRLAALPLPGLEAYRRRVDRQAGRGLRQGTAERDPEVLRRVVDEAFCSRAGDQALDMLGDLAFECGDFAGARGWWRLLAVPASEVLGRKKPVPGELRFPDPQVDVARVRAKQVLALLFDGDLAAARAEFDAFRSLHPRAAGHLAGKVGNYASILGEWLARPPDFPEHQEWPTFAGSPARDRDLPAAPPRRLWADGPTWRVRLDNLEKAPASDPADQPIVSAALARRLACQPLVVESEVLIADARQVAAFDLFTGRLLFRYDLGQDGGQLGLPPRQVHADPDAGFTLTASDGHVYARLGASAVAGAKKGGQPQGPSCLVCLDLKEDAKRPGRQRWLVQARGKAGAGACFEGAPLVHAGRVYAAVSRPAAGRTRAAVACYDADTGAPRWEQEVCEVPEGRLRAPQHLLTLAGGQLVYCTHAGAVVALDADTGKLCWGVRYPRRVPGPLDGDPPPRGLSPPVFADGRLFVAPRDAARILCLEPYTGRTLWERDGIEVVHLLGCSRGRLVFTTPQGIRAVGARTGGDADGWLQPVEGRLPGFGRGLLAGGWVFWPVQDGRLPLRALNVADGTQQRDEQYLEPTQLRRIRPGNMAYGQGCLVVAGVEELVGYVPPEHFLEQRRKDAVGAGADAHALYRLALAEIGAGRGKQALEYLRQAEKAAGASPLRDAARGERYRLLIKLAESAEQSLPREQRGPGAAKFLAEAAADFSTPQRLDALRRLADLWEGVGKPHRAVEAWQTVLREERLRRGPSMPFLSESGPGYPGGQAAEAIQWLMREHGADYSDIEKEAQAAIVGKDLAAALARYAVVYPNARQTLRAIRQAAGQQKQRHRPADLAQAFRSLLGLWPHRDEPLLLSGLARAYEAQQCWEASRDVWRLGDLRGDEEATKRLKDPEYRALAELERRPPDAQDLRLPLRRVWQAASGRLIVPSRSSLAPRKVEVVFAVRDRQLACREAASGSLRWTADLSFSPAWLGCHADMVLAAWKGGIQVVRLADGRPLWAWPVEGDPADARELSGFRLTDRHLLFFQAGRALRALRLDTGTLDWETPAPSADLRPLGGGRFQPNGYVSDNPLLLQTAGGQRLLQWVHLPHGDVVFAAPADKEPWPQPPLPLEKDCFCLVDGPRRVVLLNGYDGKEVWSWKPRLPTTLTGEPPRLFGGPDALLLLVPRNLGYDLERLDAKTGAPLWPEAFRLLGRPVDNEAVAIDRRAVYLAAGDLLLARSLANGKLLWKRKLDPPALRWQVARAGACLVVWPRQTDWLRWSWLPAGDLAVAAPLRAALGRPFPVLLFRAADGTLAQRLDFEASVPEGAVQLFPGRLVVGVPGAAWGLAPAGDKAPAGRPEGAAGRGLP
jgi:outer membrane protein assembly factor BamB